jgi:hypothetical protein
MTTFFHLHSPALAAQVQVCAGKCAQELDDVPTLPVQVAEKAIFPAGECKERHRRGHANIAGVGLGAELVRST